MARTHTSYGRPFYVQEPLDLITLCHCRLPKTYSTSHLVIANPTHLFHGRLPRLIPFGHHGRIPVFRCTCEARNRSPEICQRSRNLDRFHCALGQRVLLVGMTEGVWPLLASGLSTIVFWSPVLYENLEDVINMDGMDDSVVLPIPRV